MALRKFAAVGAAAVGLALAAAPAFAAAVTVNVNGSSANSDYDISATAKGNTTLTANGNVLTCTGSTVSGLLHGGTSQDPAAEITDAHWTGCTFAGLYNATVTVTNPDWKLHATSGYTTAANDAVAGTLDNISGVHVVIDGPIGDCSFDVSGASGSGSVQGTFNEDNGKDGQSLVVSSSGSTLTLSNVDNVLTCAGLVSNGNSATFAGEYNLDDTPAGYINIEP